MADGISKVHGLFLQAIANNGVLPIKSGIEILDAIQEKYGEGDVNINEKTLNKYVDTINEAIKNMQQNIAFVRMDWNTPSIEYLVFCNTFNSTSTNLPISYNSVECSYLKWLTEMIIINENRCIPMISAINASSAMTNTQTTTKRMTKQRSEELLKEWIVAGYLHIDDDDGTITLGPRTIGEFGRDLLQNFANVLHSCAICSSVTLKPLACPNEECQSVMDRHCAEKVLPKSKKCSACKTPWSYEN